MPNKKRKKVNDRLEKNKNNSRTELNLEKKNVRNDQHIKKPRIIIEIKKKKQINAVIIDLNLSEMKVIKWQERTNIIKTNEINLFQRNV